MRTHCTSCCFVVRFVPTLLEALYDINLCRVPSDSTAMNMQDESDGDSVAPKVNNDESYALFLAKVGCSLYRFNPRAN
jgi:hypothetical protein